MKTYYMHTLNGSPAAFFGDCICYMSHYGKANPLASSLKQIRAEQKANIEARQELGANPDDDAYGYRRVGVPT